jgi:predicted CXXCH cytochrome family protein
MVCHKVPGSTIHGTWSDTADSCARCHRTHTAAADDLLIAESGVLCLFCHGESGTQAATNVEGGLLRFSGASLRGGGFVSATMNTDNNTSSDNASLVRGLWAFSTSADNVESRAVTSTHSLGISAGIWGSGSINGTAAIPFEETTHLECVSCHDPHEFNQTYRMLRRQPVDSSIDFRGSTTYAFVTDQLVYARVADNASGILAYDTSDYTEVDYVAPDVYADNGTQIMVEYESHGPHTAPKYSQQINTWCISCHERYMSVKNVDEGVGSTDTGDAIFAYQHKTGDAMTSGNTSSSCGYGGAGCHGAPGWFDTNKNLACLACHVAHGTSAQMSVYAASVPWPGDNTTTFDGLPGTATANATYLAAMDWDAEWDTRSSLLRLDNRGVCQNAYCHPKGQGDYTGDHEQGMD